MITKRDFGTPWVSVTYVLPPAYRKRYYMVRYFRWSGHPSTLAVLTKGVPLLPGQALPLPSGGRIQVCFRFAVLHPWPVTLGFGFPSV